MHACKYCRFVKAQKTLLTLRWPYVFTVFANRYWLLTSLDRKEMRLISLFCLKLVLHISGWQKILKEQVHGSVKSWPRGLFFTIKMHSLLKVLPFRNEIFANQLIILGGRVSYVGRLNCGFYAKMLSIKCIYSDLWFDKLHLRTWNISWIRYSARVWVEAFETSIDDY